MFHFDRLTNLTIFEDKVSVFSLGFWLVFLISRRCFSHKFCYYSQHTLSLSLSLSLSLLSFSLFLSLSLSLSLFLSPSPFFPSSLSPIPLFSLSPLSLSFPFLCIFFQFFSSGKKRKNDDADVASASSPKKKKKKTKVFSGHENFEELKILPRMIANLDSTFHMNKPTRWVQECCCTL